MSGFKVTLKESLVVGAIFGGFSIVETYPLILKINTHFPGWSGDSFQFLWNQWWMLESLVKGQNPFYCFSMYYPVGTDLVAHSFTPLKAFIGAIFSLVVGFIPAFNILFLGGFVVSGVGVYFLCRRLAISRIAALAAGIYFSFSPLRMGTGLGHLNIFSVEWMPWVLYCWLTYLVSGKIRYAVLAGICLASAGYCGFNPLVLALIPWISFIVLHLKTQHLPQILKGVLIIMTTFLVLFAPVEKMFWTYIKENGLMSVEVASDISAVDLICYFLPANWHPFWRVPLSRWLSFHISPRYFYTITFGFIGLGAFFYAFQLFRRKSVRHFFLLALLGFGLSLGTQLRLMNKVIFSGALMPFYWFEKIPLLRAAREPARMANITYLAVAVLIAFAIDKIFKDNLWKVVICIAIFFEFLFLPYPVIKQFESPELEMISKQPEKEVVLQLPFWKQDNVSVYFQTMHKHPVMSGMVSRPSLKISQWLRDHPLFEDLWKLQDQRIPMFLDNEIPFYILNSKCNNHQIVVFMVPSGRQLTLLLPDEIKQLMNIEKNDEIRFKGWITLDPYKMEISPLPGTVVSILNKSSFQIGEVRKKKKANVYFPWKQHDISNAFRKFGIKYVISPPGFEDTNIFFLLSKTFKLKPLKMKNHKNMSFVRVYQIKAFKAENLKFNKLVLKRKRID